MKMALLLIDIQNDYFPGGKRELEGSLEAGLQAQKVLTFFREKKWPVFHVQHIAVGPKAAFFLAGTEGAHIHENVRPLPGEVVIEKHFPNCFRETPLLDHLRREGVTQVVICGMMTHMCVDAGTRAAADFGFECIVLHDACATRALSFRDEIIPGPQVHGAFLAALGAAYAQVISLKEFLARKL
jgi:nicotinamidase-related amidase